MLAHFVLAITRNGVYLFRWTLKKRSAIISLNISRITAHQATKETYYKKIKRYILFALIGEHILLSSIINTDKKIITTLFIRFSVYFDKGLYIQTEKPF